MTGISRKMSRTLAHAGEAVTEAETEMETLTAEIDTLEEQLDNVMEQPCIYSLAFTRSYALVCHINQTH